MRNLFNKIKQKFETKTCHGLNKAAYEKELNINNLNSQEPTSIYNKISTVSHSAVNTLSEVKAHATGSIVYHYLNQLDDELKSITYTTFQDRLNTLDFIPVWLSTANENHKAYLDISTQLLWFFDDRINEDREQAELASKSIDALSVKWQLPNIKQVEQLSLRANICSNAEFKETYTKLSHEIFFTDAVCTYENLIGCYVSEAFLTYSKSKLIKKLIDIPTALDFIYDYKFVNETSENKVAHMVIDALCFLDFNRSRLPLIDKYQISKPDNGIWELFEIAKERKLPDFLYGHDPVKDINKHTYVGIDFGTSSTVVSFIENGEYKLLRVGVQDFTKPIEAKHFENPTVLEFIDLPSMFDRWNQKTYQPNINWDHVRCSHEAQTRFRDNDGDQAVLSSILPHMKLWALQDEETDQRVCIKGYIDKNELTLKPQQLRRPTKGMPIELSPDDHFDPIELYAYFLGLNINWRARGIFMKYLMTFPVDYPVKVKEKILSAFNRGLQRSFPRSIIESPAFSAFSVEERANEPAALAASTLPALNIMPTSEGVAYAVFDCGGGTTDFDFGIYRSANAEEENNFGYERVFESLHRAGDRYYGGEKLLEHWAYYVFISHLDQCNEKHIQFTKPVDAKSVTDIESFVDKGIIAQTNTQMLISKLRPVIENDAEIQSIKLYLINRDGEKVYCDFNEIHNDFIDTELFEKQFSVFNSFISSIDYAFKEIQPEQIEVILSGNGVRNKKILKFFDQINHLDEAGKIRLKAELAENKIYNNDPKVKALYQKVFTLPRLNIHLPLLPDNKDPYKATCKTAVALGLLLLRPGSSTHVINHMLNRANGDAPFRFHIGSMKSEKFVVVMPQGSEYMKWFELGIIRENLFELYSTTSAQALTNHIDISDVTVFTNIIEFEGDTLHHRAFVRAISPNEIEICSAQSIDVLKKGEYENLQIIKLI